MNAKAVSTESIEKIVERAEKLGISREKVMDHVETIDVDVVRANQRKSDDLAEEIVELVLNKYGLDPYNKNDDLITAGKALCNALARLFALPIMIISPSDRKDVAYEMITESVKHHADRALLALYEASKKKP